MERLTRDRSRRFRVLACHLMLRRCGQVLAITGIMLSLAAMGCNTTSPLTAGAVAGGPIDTSGEPAGGASGDPNSTNPGATPPDTTNSPAGTDPNDADKFKAPTVNAQADVATMNTTRLLTLHGTDVLHRDLTFVVTSPASHGLMGDVDNSANDTGTVTYTPAANFVGNDSFTFRATNGLRWSVIATFTITVSRPATISQSVLTTQNTPVLIRLQGSEPTGADLTFATATGPAHGRLGALDNTPAASALVTYTPAAGFVGTDVFSFTAGMGSATSLPATVTITVALADAGAPPVISPAGPLSITVAQNSTAQSPQNRISFSAMDIDTPAGLVWSIPGPPAHGSALIGSGSPSNSGGIVTVTYAPATAYLGADQFRVQVTDGRNSTEAIVNVTVAGGATNNPPVPNPAGPLALCVVQNSQGSSASNRVTLSATDPDPSTTLTWTVSAAAGHGTAAIVSGSPSPSGGPVVVSYQPTGSYAGSDTYEVQVDDGQGGVAKVRVNVNVNSVPAFGQASPLALQVGQNSASTNPGNRLTLSASDADVAASLTWSISTAAGHGTARVESGSPSASGGAVVVSYQPTTGYSGSDSFVVRVSDGSCGQATLTVNVTVAGPPTVNPAGPLSMTVLQNSASTDSSNRVTLSATGANAAPGFAWSISTAATHGTAQVASGSPSASGASVVVSYQPASSYLGSDAFTIRVDNGMGGISTVSANVMVVAPTPPGTYYVDTNNAAANDNNPGTAVLPFKTIQRGANASNPGDTVIVKAGTYTSYTFYDCVYITNKNGTSSAPITIRTFQQPSGAYDSVVIQGQGQRTYGLRISNSSYLVIDGFEFTNLMATGVSVGRGFWDATDTANSPAHHITVRNCVVHDNGPPNTWNGGFEVVAPSHDVLFEYCESYANGRGFYFGSSHETNQAILPYSISVQYCHAHHNALYGNNSDGFTTAGARNVLISHCVSHDNTADQITEEGPWADNNIWEYCVVYNGNSQNNPDGDGNGFKIGNINAIQLQQGYVGARNHIVRNCISFNNRNRGFEDTEGARGSQYYNNVAYSNGYWGFLTEGQGAIFNNNIGLQNAVTNRYNGIFGDAVLFGTTVASSDYNFWSDLSTYGPFTSGRHTSYDGVIVEPHSNAGNPMFVSGTPTVDTNLYVGTPANHVPNPNFGVVSAFQLATGSPCLDAGVNVGQTYPMVGSAYDMGCYEHP